MAQAEFRAGMAGVQPRAQLAGGVVERELVEALAVQALAVQTGDHARVVDARVDAGGEGHRIGAAVQAADDDGAVDVALDELQGDLGADAWREEGAPVGTGGRAAHTHPGAGAFVAGGVALGIGSEAGGAVARVGLLAALEVHLYLDAVAALGMYRRVLDANHPCAERARCRGRGDEGRHHGHGRQHALEAVLVGAVFDRATLEQARGLAAQVVAGLVLDRQHGEGVVGTVVAGPQGSSVVQGAGVGAVAGVVDQREACARAQDAGRANALEALGLQLRRGQGLRSSAVCACRILVAVGACTLVALEQGHLAQIQGGPDGGGGAGELGVVPTAHGDGIGGQAVTGSSRPGRKAIGCCAAKRIGPRSLR